MTTNPLNCLRKAQECQLAGQNPEALEAYRRFLKARPGHAGAWADMGGLLMNIDRLPEALEACERALQIDPLLPFARVNLACVRLKMGQIQEAEKELLQVLAKAPQRVDACLALSECLIRRDDFDGALGILKKVLELEPGNKQAFDKVIFVHARRREWDAQYDAVARRLQVVPGCPETMMELSVLDLLQGVMPKGWDEFECRFQLPGQVVSIVGQLSKPLWEGQPFPGKTLLLHWEQGYGDTLMFIRYASLAKARGGRVVAMVQPPLADLVSTCPGVDQVISHGDPLPDFDFQLPLMSLPRVFRTDLASIPAEVPYLEIPERVPNREWIAKVVATSEGRVRIGYAWAGRPQHLNDHNRSMPPDRLAPLKALPNVAWHSFQVPVAEPTPLPSVSLGPILSNFSDTAYALSGMDLVITVDTSLAHAAGALGIPTFLMVPFDPDWRWLMDRPDSPWYPSLRIYRQPRFGDWDSVVSDILRDLTQD